MLLQTLLRVLRLDCVVSGKNLSRKSRVGIGPIVSLDVLRAIPWTSLLIDGFEVVDMIAMMDVNVEDRTQRFKVHMSHEAMSHITCSQSHRIVRARVHRSGKYHIYA